MVMKNAWSYCLGWSAFVFSACSLSASNWPGWRGPDGIGVSPEKNLPLNWSTNENVRWRVDLPGPGNSSPIIWGKRVFVTQAIEKDKRRTLMCFDRESGKMWWQSGVAYTEQEPTQESNPYCAGTPATDGQRVFACFGSAGVYAYDMEGKEVWHRDLGKLIHMFGNAVSPVLFGDLCILNFSPDQKSRLIALNKKTGETVWEVEPPKPDESERQQAMPGGGRGGFGPGMFVAPQMLSQADKNADQKVSKEEFAALADTWFDKLDPEKTGKLTQEQLVERFNSVLPPPQGMGGGGGEPRGDGSRPPGGPGGRGGFGAGRFLGPGLFSVADTDKDGSLTREELKSTFAKWFAAWDTDKSGALDENKLREGLNAALPRPQMGGPGGGGPGGGRGPGGPGGGRGGGDPSGSWSTPIIIKTSGHDELVVNFQNRLVGYDPKSGRQLWVSKGLGGTIYTSPMWGEGTVVAMSSGMGGGNAIAIKPGGSGDVTESQRLWRLDRVKSGIGSGVIHDGHLYTISQDGVAECMNLKTGERLWEERLKGSCSRNGSWSSMLLAGDKIYVPNQSGDVFVLRASPKFELLASNGVHESTNASLAAADGEIIFRTDKSLWCFAKAK
jgi:outer membrane protein assembly factor BamB/Ca2+-binding EF-hand superfamily protein